MRLFGIAWLALALVATALVAPVLVAGAARAGTTLDTVQARGTVVCGVNMGVTGFSVLDSQGVWRGFDADLCRAVAAAVFGDWRKVRFVPLTAAQRFPALLNGQIDVLFRQTTLTLARDTTLGLRVVTANLYDGHAFMVRTAAGMADARGLEGMRICLSPGTTNEAVTNEWFHANRLHFTAVPHDRMQDNAVALQAAECDAIGSDATQLAALRSLFDKPEDFVILPQRLSKEPYGPVVRRDDAEWFDVIRWTVMALIEAEELGITAANVEALRRDSNSADIRRLLGVGSELGADLKLDPAWAYNVIRSVGNYGELFDRHLGAQSPLRLDRGLNRLWTAGGLMYAWPLR